MWSMWSIMAFGGEWGPSLRIFDRTCPALEALRTGRIARETASDDAFGFHRRDIALGEADFPEHLVGVLAELRRRAADRARRGGELGHDAGHLERLAVCRDDLLDH